MAKFNCFEHPETRELSWDDADAKGYDGWAVVASSTRLPAEHEEWDAKAKKLKTDPAKKAKRERASRARDPDAMEERVASLEADVEELKKTLASLAETR